jgi:hypothetical protein
MAKKSAAHTKGKYFEGVAFRMASSTNGNALKAL